MQKSVTSSFPLVTQYDRRRMRPGLQLLLASIVGKETPFQARLSRPESYSPCAVQVQNTNRPKVDVVQRLDELVRGGKIVALVITQRETNGICILALAGRLVLGKESGGFRTTASL